MVVVGLSTTADNHEPYLDQGDALDQAISSEKPADPLHNPTGLQEIQDRMAQLQPTDPNPDPDARLLSLFTRIQALERDYALLQGRVEELEYLYHEEREMNRRRFLDMDRRLREQFGEQLAPEDTLADVDLSTETGLYRRAMVLLDAEDYAQASEMFATIINTYPNGEKVADAMYWLGEIGRSVEPKNLEQSRQYFVQMLTMYVDHARIPEAITKLGMVYHELGNETRALEYLDRVIAEYPDHDAARLAETYAEELR